MSERSETNSRVSDAVGAVETARRRVLARPACGRSFPGFVLILVVLALLSLVACSPRLLEDAGQTVNPIEILDKSPRIYEIGFKPFADSLETARASSYLAGGLDAASFPSPRVAAALLDSVRAQGLAPSEVAQLEYIKATRRFSAGAEQAASQHLKRAMAADPSFKPPYILLGEMLLERGALPQAFDLYSQVLSRDGSDTNALVGLARCHMMMGRLEDARKALVDAVIFDRVNLKAWSTLSVVAGLQGYSVANHDAPDLGIVRPMRGRHYKILVDASLKDCPTAATAWIAYASERAVWKYEGKYMRYFGLPRYAPTYQEDVDCYMVLAAAWRTLALSDSVTYSETCDAGYLEYLSRVAEDGYLVSHVLFDHVCIQAPTAARHFSVEVLDKLREYVDTYVIVPKS